MAAATTTTTTQWRTPIKGVEAGPRATTLAFFKGQADADIRLSFRMDFCLREVSCKINVKIA